jgi:hypothetical protein
MFVTSMVRLFGIRVCTDNLPLFPGMSRAASIDLSNATKLRDVVFRLQSWNVEWTAMALQNITPEHRDVRQITIRIPEYLAASSAGANIGQTIGEAAYGQ